MTGTRWQAGASLHRAGAASADLRRWQVQVVTALPVVSMLLLAIATAAFGQDTGPLVRPAPTPRAWVSVAPQLSVRSSTRTALDIRVSQADALPRNSFVRVRGLPPAIALSEGYVTAPGAWAVALYALPNLQMVVPIGVEGRTEIRVSLISGAGEVLAEAKSILIISAAPPRALPPSGRPAIPKPPIERRSPRLSPAAKEVAEKFVVRGQHELDQGHIASARQFFLRAAQANYAPGALLLAATYDPRELSRWGVLGVLPDVDEARKWYERARDLGAPGAEARLMRLDGAR